MKYTQKAEFTLNVFLLYVFLEENIVLLVKQCKIMENYYKTTNLSFKLNHFHLHLAQFQARKVNSCGKSFFHKPWQRKQANPCLSVASKTSFNKKSHKTKAAETSKANETTKLFLTCSG